MGREITLLRSKDGVWAIYVIVSTTPDFAYEFKLDKTKIHDVHMYKGWRDSPKFPQEETGYPPYERGVQHYLKTRIKLLRSRGYYKVKGDAVKEFPHDIITKFEDTYLTDKAMKHARKLPMASATFTALRKHYGYTGSSKW